MLLRRFICRWRVRDIFGRSGARWRRGRILRRDGGIALLPIEHCQELRSASRACHHPSGNKSQEHCGENDSHEAPPTARLTGGGAGHFGTVQIGIGRFADIRWLAETLLQNGTRQMQQFSRT
jgi:hypothetical protein